MRWGVVILGATGSEKPKPAHCPEVHGQPDLIARYAGETPSFSLFSSRPVRDHKLTVMILREEEHAIPTQNTCGRLPVRTPFQPNSSRLTIFFL